MKKYFLIIFFISGLFSKSYARHIYGGEMIYEYISESGNMKKYRITLRLFRDNNGGGAQLPANVYIGIFDYGTKQHYPASKNYYDVPVTTGPVAVSVNISPCIGYLPSSPNYSVATYSFVTDLPDNTQGYICSFETCCRVDNLDNVFQPGGGGQQGGNGTGSTYVCKIPGTAALSASEHNSSPQFVTSLDLVCYDKPFTWNFSASDPDGDSLVYKLTPAYNRTSASSANATPPASPSSISPDYPLLVYINGYSSQSPLGSGASINPVTGIFSGIAPSQGQYVVSVIVFEYRNGNKIGEHRKDFILRVEGCELAAAQLPVNSTTCDGFSRQFENISPSTLIHTWHWDFGVPAQTNDTSNIERPLFTYPDTGIYNVKLVVNPGEACSDSATMRLGVYPGFFPDFQYAGVCINNPTKFTDQTTTRYGVVNSWRWDFADASATADTSRLQNPSYIYSKTGIYNVRFIATNSKGCIDTLIKPVEMINKPPIGLPFKDTLICSIDSLQIPASGNGVFTWIPNGNIINANTASPVVFPKQTTWYKVNLNDNGCVNNDSVRVRVVDFVSLNIMPDTTICAGDAVRLQNTTDGLQFLWTPSASLNNPTLQQPVANPTLTTPYQLTASIGKCNTTSSVTIKTIPYPLSVAGSDSTICFGTKAQLNGKVNTGATFSWSPSASLDNAAIINPVAAPLNEGINAYILTSFESNGCPKPGRDTVIITVLPKVKAFAGNDTSVVVNQPLQLEGSGGESYFWSPPIGLNNVTAYNPVAVLGSEYDSIRYNVYITDFAGCLDSASVLVKIFNVVPQVFVPTAFTPNKDGLNDKVAPIAVGIERIEYFRIFNRWGQLVFSTTTNEYGWDGKIGGKEQTSSTFVWAVKAIDYLGRPYFSKGTVTIIK